MANGERGSDKWIQDSVRQPVVSIETSDVERFLALAKRRGVKLIDWHTVGTPQPDVVRGVLRVSPGSANAVFKHFRDLDGWFWHDWFPVGIPKPDEFHVRFSNERFKA